MSYSTDMINSELQNAMQKFPQNSQIIDDSGEFNKEV